MSMGWFIARIKDHKMKIWKSEAVGGLQPQRLRENIYLTPTLRRETKDYLTVG